ncbi:MAG TPA: VOC family protein [Anaerolineae bacterium]|nr:VOC family protein [Anaerolineae bacterium]
MKHTIVHFEIPADDVERAKEFYSELFGWQFSTPPGFEDYWVFDTGDPYQDPGGGLMARQVPEQGIVHYIQVESVEDHVTRVQELGGEVLMPKSPVPGMGWFAQFLDTEGNCFAVWQSDRSAA